MTNADKDKTSTAYESAEAAHTSALADESAKTKAHAAAIVNEDSLKAEKAVLTTWKGYGKTYLASNVDDHQVKWNTNKIAGARLLKTA
jgi:hypothetical protein